MAKEEEVVGSVDDTGEVDSVKEGGAFVVEGLIRLLLFLLLSMEVLQGRGFVGDWLDSGAILGIFELWWHCCLKSCYRWGID